jgi:fatty-acyl-CoA synthase
MRGTMMDFPLTLPTILERAGKIFGDVEIVSRMPDRSLHRYTYKDFYRRSHALAQALTQSGLRRGDRVATLMYNGYAHLEAYFGIPVAGAVLHTLNLRLHPSELAFIVNHAQDRFLIVEDILLPLLEQFKNQVKLEKVLVVPSSGHPVSPPYENYEDFIARARGAFAYPELDENEGAAMCYTSGTTGQPKGVVYSHRALVLHSFAFALKDCFAISQHDVILPAMSMFHANAWGVPFAATMMGSKQVFPGRHVDAESLLELFDREQVTFSGAVPTVWLPVLDLLDQEPKRWKLAPGLRIGVAGSACPESMIRRFDRHHVRVIHLWGLTETTPVATVCDVKPGLSACSEDDKFRIRAKQGLCVPFVEARVIGDAGEAPWDGSTLGEIQLRGPWVAGSYYNFPENSDKWTSDGWFRTGDVATIDPEGYIKIADRTKDLIKSGGEWISSVDLENALVGHPAIREAAVIAVHHPKWLERPVAVLVARENERPAPEDLRAFLESRFAKWQLPDAFVYVSELPHTSTGKLLKSELRKQFKDWSWEKAAHL